LIRGGLNLVPLYKYSNSFLSFRGVYDFILLMQFLIGFNFVIFY